tara:strand:+ start:861 stop:1025 length:165 start_codon:yes stop_codon:yes gene_type:complete
MKWEKTMNPKLPMGPPNSSMIADDNFQLECQREKEEKRVRPHLSDRVEEEEIIE